MYFSSKVTESTKPRSCKESRTSATSHTIVNSQLTILTGSTSPGFGSEPSQDNQTISDLFQLVSYRLPGMHHPTRKSPRRPKVHRLWARSCTSLFATVIVFDPEVTECQRADPLYRSAQPSLSPTHFQWPSPPFGSISVLLIGDLFQLPSPRRCTILQGNLLDGPRCAGSGQGPVHLSSPQSLYSIQR